MAKVPIEIHIGCAGWSIPQPYAGRFPPGGSHLERYAGRFNAVEINSSFYRPHQPSTYAHWAAAVPAGFRFAVKVPREITHHRRLVDAAEPLGQFLAEACQLGDKLGPLLVQIPPSLAFTEAVLRTFLASLRQRFSGGVVCEPRHRSWFTQDADRLLVEFEVARAAADPAVVPTAAAPGGWNGLAYYRLHGSPRMYYSAYPPEYLDALADKLRLTSRMAPAWCIFDNTAEGHATADGLRLLEQIGA